MPHAAVHTAKVTLTPVTAHAFTWLHKAGAKNSFTYFTALFTPDKGEEKRQMRQDGKTKKELGRVYSDGCTLLKNEIYFKINDSWVAEAEQPYLQLNYWESSQQ